MLAETTSMTSMIIGFITREGKSPKNMTKGGWVRMSQPSMPKVHRGGESDRIGCGGVGGVHRVEAVRAVTLVEHHPGTGILDRKNPLRQIQQL